MLRVAIHRGIRAVGPMRAASRVSSIRASSAMRFSKEHEWVTIGSDGVTATIGITDHAQNALGDIVFVDLPAIGDKFKAGDVFASIESVKAASDCYAPVSGVVTAKNEALADQPAVINSDAEGAGWLMKVKMLAPDEYSQLMDRDAYTAFTKK